MTATQRIEFMSQLHYAFVDALGEPTNDVWCLSMWAYLMGGEL